MNCRAPRNLACRYARVVAVSSDLLDLLGPQAIIEEFGFVSPNGVV